MHRAPLRLGLVLLLGLAGCYASHGVEGAPPRPDDGATPPPPPPPPPPPGPPPPGPPPPPPGPLTITSVCNGSLHSCALRGDDRIFCWGEGSDGQLGDGRATSSFDPVEVRGIPTPDALFCDFANNTFVVTESGEVWGWGQNGNGTVTAGAGATPPDDFRWPIVPSPVRLTEVPPSIGVFDFRIATCALHAPDGYTCFSDAGLQSGVLEGGPIEWATAFWPRVLVRHPGGVYVNYFPGFDGLDVEEEIVGLRGAHTVAIGSIDSVVDDSTYLHLCRYDGDGAWRCGLNRDSELAPAPRWDGYEAIDMGNLFGCGLRRGQVECRGPSWRHYRPGLMRHDPELIEAPGVHFERLFVGGRNQSCGQASDGSLFCWASSSMPDDRAGGSWVRRIELPF